MTNTKIQFYGTLTCGDCLRSKAFLKAANIDYDFIDIAVVEGAAEKVTKINNGMQSVPTIVFPNGVILVEPTNDELRVEVEKIR